MPSCSRLRHALLSRNLPCARAPFLLARLRAVLLDHTKTFNITMLCTYMFLMSDCTAAIKRGSQPGISCLMNMAELLMECTGTRPASLGDPCGARAGGVADERGGEPGRAGAVPGPLPAPVRAGAGLALAARHLARLPGNARALPVRGLPRSANERRVKLCLRCVSLLRHLVRAEQAPRPSHATWRLPGHVRALSVGVFSRVPSL